MIRDRIYSLTSMSSFCCFFFQAEDGIRDGHVTGVQTVLFRSPQGARGEQPQPSRRVHRAALQQGRNLAYLRQRCVRSEERRVGKECRSGWEEQHRKEKGKEERMQVSEREECTRWRRGGSRDGE